LQAVLTNAQILKMEANPDEAIATLEAAVRNGYMPESWSFRFVASDNPARHKLELSTSAATHSINFDAKSIAMALNAFRQVNNEDIELQLNVDSEAATPADTAARLSDLSGKSVSRRHKALLGAIQPLMASLHYRDVALNWHVNGWQMVGRTARHANEVKSSIQILRFKPDAKINGNAPYDYYIFIDDKLYLL